MVRPVLLEGAATQVPTILSIRMLVSIQILPLDGAGNPNCLHSDGFPSSQISEVLDGLTTISHVFDQRDGCPSSAEVSECRDGFPRPGDTEYSDTVFSRDVHADENSERVRQSDSGVQIVRASRSPSELSAHQMGLLLAGTIRLKSEPIGIDPTGILDIGETERFDYCRSCALAQEQVIRKGQRRIRNKQGHTYQQENSTSVSRVDGHPPKPSLSLYDRMLLRKYPDAGMKTMLSPSSTLVSSPPVVHPVESVKRRRRFCGKEKFQQSQYRSGRAERAHSRSRKALPVDFRPRLQSLLFILAASVLPRLRCLTQWISHFCIFPS